MKAANKGVSKIVYAAIAVFIAVIVALAVLPSGAAPSNAEHEYIRIHIRANSNSEADQGVKYRIKEAVVRCLTPLIAECATREDAYKTVKKNLSAVERAADKELLASGFEYKSAARLCDEYFPARTYEDTTLESGYYDALILELGAAAGDNWWCVVYPPLCFINSEYTNGEGIIYKSKLMEIIRGLKNSKG